MYDLDDNGDLDYHEIKQYLQQMAFSHLTLDDDEVWELFKKIDLNGDGTIEKSEMYEFIKVLLAEYKEMSFNKL